VDSDAAGSFRVNVLSGNVIVGTVEFDNASITTGTTDNGQAAGVVILTVILVIIFVVLLIVLIVLLTRKPDREDELGESYY
jgi:preprotein translocase subunit SecG